MRFGFGGKFLGVGADNLRVNPRLLHHNMLGLHHSLVLRWHQDLLLRRYHRSLWQNKVSGFWFKCQSRLVLRVCV
jgi:hypothetical protein